MALQDLRAPTLGQALRPNVWDVVALILVVGAMVLIVYGGEQTVLPLSTLDVSPVSLDPANLPAYALRTTMRMLLAIICSIIFTFIYAPTCRRAGAEMVLIRCSTSCSRCRSSASHLHRGFFQTTAVGCSAPSSPACLRSSPARPGT